MSEPTTAPTYDYTLDFGDRRVDIHSSRVLGDWWIWAKADGIESSAYHSQPCKPPALQQALDDLSARMEVGV